MECFYPMSTKTKTGKITAVRCGRCKPCLEKKRQDKFIRILEHSKGYQYTTFVTLTYDDENLKWGINPTLCKRDFILFMKKLRKKLSKLNVKISYYTVGEYGTKFHRPHYHMIIFGLSKASATTFIRSTWSNGLIHVGTLSARSINYVCKYHVLRGFNPEGTEKCFSLSSKHLGESYVDEMKQWHNEDLLNRYFYHYLDLKLSLPEYYKQKLYNPRIKELITNHFIEKNSKKKELIKDFKMDAKQKEIINRNFTYKNLNNHSSNSF